MDTVQGARVVPVQKNKTVLLWGPVLTMVILAMLFTAVYRFTDNITVNQLKSNSDVWTPVLAYLVVGGWVGFISGLVFVKLMGQQIWNHDFKGVVVNNPKLHVYAFVAGILSAGSTYFGLVGNQLGDPGMILGLSSAVILYTVGFELLHKKLIFRQIWLPTILVLIGSILVAFCGSISVTLAGLVVVLVVGNGMTAVSEIIEQKGAQEAGGISLFVWRFLWLAIGGTVAAVVIVSLLGTWSLFWDTIKHLGSLWWLVLITMFFVFLGQGYKQVSKQRGASVSKILIVMSLASLVGLPFVVIGNQLMPGIFGNVSTDPLVWGVRVLGGLCLVFGVWKVTKKFDELGLKL